KRYGIKSTKQLRNWILKYNSHEELKASGTGGAPIMTNGRKTTFEERIEIVRFCIENQQDYTQAAQQFQVSYQQVYSWTNKYLKSGI
ncbi:helix-turn-helix domain-containing protein, partial [Peribacillus sp. SIMBA_075]